MFMDLNSPTYSVRSNNLKDTITFYEDKQATGSYLSQYPQILRLIVY